MMRLKIVQAGDPVLRQPARAVAPEEIGSARIQSLIDLMLTTLRDAPGVGLAAPQVGVALQLAIIEDRAEYQASLPAEALAERERSPTPFHVLINPQLELVEGESVAFFEGCLSVAGFVAVTPRARKVRVRYLDREGQSCSVEASGWYARILQHEIDHLGGALYIDRMHSRTFMSIENMNRHWKDRTVSEILEAL